jgi:lipoprotein-releasing system permease protein
MWHTAPVNKLITKIPYELWIGWRYVRAKRRTAGGNRFISFISGLSAIGIALGVWALVVVISVMNGFQREVRDRMLSVIPHIEVNASNGAMDDWQNLAVTAKQVPSVVGVAPFVSGQAMASRDDALRGVGIRGIDPQRESEVSDLTKQLIRGSIDRLVAGEFGIVVGRHMSNVFGLQVGDKLTIIGAAGTPTPTGFVPRLKAFTVVGVFESGHFEYDSALVVMHWKDAAAFTRSGGVTGLRIRTTDMNQAPQTAQALMNVLPSGVFARDWSRENGTWFAAVQVEKRMMFIILTLIIAVAAFNLVSMLVMTVTEKHADIAILRTFGATPKSIQKIFIVQGALIGWLGTLVGIVTGVLTALNIGTIVKTLERLFGFQALPDGVYVITAMPSHVKLSDVTTIAVIAFFMSLVATLYPSYRASQLAPAEALRYE